MEDTHVPVFVTYDLENLLGVVKKKSKFNHTCKFDKRQRVDLKFSTFLPFGETFILQP